MDNYKTLTVLTVKEFVEVCSNLKEVSKRKSNWLKLIEADKMTCPVSGLRASVVKFEVVGKRNPSFHYNFYSECGKFFTIDHIIPRSKKGAITDLNNIQPMLGIYNQKKGNRIITNYKSLL